MRRRNKYFIAGLVILLISLGFLRDAVFVGINESTGQGPGGTGPLFMWKWPLTFGFVLAYLGLTCVFLNAIFDKKKYVWLAVCLFALLLFISAAAGIFAYAFSSFDSAYPFIRMIMGIAQSPIPLIILIPACMLNEALTVDN